MNLTHPIPYRTMKNPAPNRSNIVNILEVASYGSSTNTTVSPDATVVAIEVDPTLNKEKESKLHRFRKELGEILESHKFHIAVIILTIIDVVLLFIELLLEVTEERDAAHREELNIAREVLFYSGVGILAFFMVEIVMKIFAFGHRFFTNIAFVVDAVIVIVSFTLELALRGVAREAIGILIILRLWRVVRIAFGVAYSVQIENKEALEVEQRKNALLQAEVNSFKAKGGADVQSLMQFVKRIATEEKFRVGESCAEEARALLSAVDVGAIPQQKKKKQKPTVTFQTETETETEKVTETETDTQTQMKLPTANASVPSPS